MKLLHRLRRVQDRARESKRLHIVSLLLMAAAIIVLRRPGQFLTPDVWNEDGIGLVSLAQQGIGSLGGPVNGYYIVPAKTILYLAARLGIFRLPVISYWLTVAATLGVVLAVALCPTVLRWRWLSAISLLLLPTDPEVIGVGLYTLWWASILVLLSVLWSGDENVSVRAAFLVIGGLSSPVIVGTLPLFLLRAFLHRTRNEYALAVLALVISGIQVSAMLQPSIARILERDPWEDFFYGVRAFLASYPALFAPFGRNEKFALGLIMAMALLAMGIAHARKGNGELLWIIAVYAACVGLSLARLPARMIHPNLAGPRYFFLPFTILSWALIWIAANNPGWKRTVSIAVIVLALYGTIRLFTRTQESLEPWPIRLQACIARPGAGLRVHNGGEAATAWWINVSQAECQALVRDSWFKGAT